MSSESKLGDFAGIVFALLLLAGWGFASCVAPCSWYGCAPVSAVPSRCFDGVSH